MNINQIILDSIELIKEKCKEEGRKLPLLIYENDLNCLLFSELNKRLEKQFIITTELYSGHKDYKKNARIDMALFKNDKVEFKKTNGVPDSLNPKEFEALIELKMYWKMNKQKLIEELKGNLEYLKGFKKNTTLKYLICFDYNGHLSHIEKKNLDVEGINFVYVNLKNI